MKVTLLASTTMLRIPDSVEDTPFGAFFYSNAEALQNDADTLSHFAGRSCYQAWNMEREATATNMGYIDNILKQDHGSVLEHGSATFYIEGVTRNLTHELIRHRHLSYSELSQRFVNMEDAKTVVAPALRQEGTQSLAAMPRSIIAEYKAKVDKLLGMGKTRKQAREAARGDLPGNTETRIVVTGNHRAWRDVLYKRYATNADAEIIELSEKLLRRLRVLAPAIYQDFPDTPFEK